jgi:hypothetical protein
MTHQWLLLWIARKMTADGFILGGYEGPTPQGGIWNVLPVPFEIASVRPDAWGIVASTGEIAVGEAKTADDLASAHTQRQLRVFGRLLQLERSAICRLYLAVPRSAAYLLDRALVKAEIIGEKNIIRMHVPDCLVLESSSEYA